MGADTSLRRIYGVLDAAGLAELQALLPDSEEEEEQLEGLDIDGEEEVDPDAALQKMQDNLDALENRVGIFDSDVPMSPHPHALTPAPPQRRGRRRYAERRRGARLAQGRGVAPVPHRYVGVIYTFGAA